MAVSTFLIYFQHWGHHCRSKPRPPGKVTYSWKFTTWSLLPSRSSISFAMSTSCSFGPMVSFFWITACSCRLPCLSTYGRWPWGCPWPDSQGMTWLSSGLRACSQTKVKGPRKYFWITEFSKWLISICKYIKDIIFGSLIFT